MSSISPIDSSAYQNISSIAFPVAPMDTLPSGTGKVASINSEDGNNSQYNNPDLSAYYNNIHKDDLNSDVASSVVQSAHNLENAMVSAIANGYTVNDACNIKLAQIAYKASSDVLKTTFELSV